MNAVRKDDYQDCRPSKLRKQKSKTNPYRNMITESAIKLTVNIFLSSVAIGSLLQLLPYQSAQKSKLEEVSREVNKTEARVNELRDNFSQNFATGEVKKVMQEQNNVISPNQLRVVFSPQTDLENQTQISQKKR